MSEATRISPEDAIDRIWELAKSIDFCMFVTWDGERQRARPLSARPNRDEGRIYFLTDAVADHHRLKDQQLVESVEFLLGAVLLGETESDAQGDDTKDKIAGEPPAFFSREDTHSKSQRSRKQ